MAACEEAEPRLLAAVKAVFGNAEAACEEAVPRLIAAVKAVFGIELALRELSSVNLSSVAEVVATTLTVASWTSPPLT